MLQTVHRKMKKKRVAGGDPVSQADQNCGSEVQTVSAVRCPLVQVSQEKAGFCAVI